MSNSGIPQRSRRHLELFQNLFVHLILGCILTVCWASFSEWRFSFPEDPDQVQRNTLIAVGICFVGASLILRVLGRYPGGRSLALVLPTLVAVFLAAAVIFLMTRLGYSRQGLVNGFIFATFWCVSGHFYTLDRVRYRFALVPFGRTELMEDIPNVEIQLLTRPEMEQGEFDAVVADLHSEDISANWEKFLARCTLNQVPVYHITQISESLTGRVRIDQLSENAIGSLLPSPFYRFFKRVLDLVIVIVTLPVVIPLMLIASIAIRLIDGRPVLFRQQRIGYRGQPFEMVKFRTMRVDKRPYAVEFAEVGDSRVTALGRFLRRTRIDELPQFWNVFKGEMSLIGPRPEQTGFSENFESELPFYEYRHAVKPGITGWAQVTHGYAGDTDATRVKIEHDFYYIKNFSLWLDVVIILKTFKTLITGNGAR